MSAAVTGTICAKVHLYFKERIDADHGSFYMMAIEQDQVIIASAVSIEEVREALVGSSKPIVEGTFWEEYLEYKWVGTGFDDILTIDVAGRFAFEGEGEDTLEQYGLADGSIEALLLAWAEDGESLKRIPALVGVEGYLSELENERRFEGF